jgi:hypothetical protein
MGYTVLYLRDLPQLLHTRTLLLGQTAPHHSLFISSFEISDCGRTVE